MSMRCVAVKATLSAHGEHAMTTAMAAHVEGCCSCRTALSAHRSLHDALSALAHVEYFAPADILPNVMMATGPWAVPERSTGGDRRVPVAAAAALATAAAGTAVLFRLYRQRAA